MRLYLSTSTSSADTSTLSSYTDPQRQNILALKGDSYV
jgi:hypothetical protein